MKPFRATISIACAVFALAADARTQADADEPEQAAEEVFSGPQKGEKLVSFKVVGVYDELAGKEFDPVGNAAGKPTLIVFVHKLTRPSHRLVRMLTDYAADRSLDEAGKQRLVPQIVWLSADPSAAREYLTKTRRVLGLRAPVGVSVDGLEGPGAYGLNRNVTLTVLIGRAGRVTANFALLQPSDTDAPQILAEVAKLLGEEPPTMEDLLAAAPDGGRGMGGGMRRGTDPRLLASFERLKTPDLTIEQIAAIAAQIDARVKAQPDRQTDLGRLAGTLTKRRDFELIGTAAARDHIVRWAKAYGRRGREGQRR